MKRPLILILAGCFGLLLAGCSAKYYRASADKEVARIIAEKSPGCPTWTAASRSSRPTASRSMNCRWHESRRLSWSGEPGGSGGTCAPLERALELAVKFSRAYQLEKEKVYLAALEPHDGAQPLYTPLCGHAQAAYRSIPRKFDWWWIR
jgi:hypothetical protein